MYSIFANILIGDSGYLSPKVKLLYLFKMTIKNIDKIVQGGVNGENSNMYYGIYNALRFLLETGYISDSDTLTVKQLRTALYKAINKQDKAIEKYLE